MSMADPAGVASVTRLPAGHPSADSNTEHEDRPPLQTMPIRAGSLVAPPLVRTVLRSSGNPLSDATRSYFEPRFGYDLSPVRVHTDSNAERSAALMGATAYTSGLHVAFARGRYEPGSTSGQHLIAHELAHVVQQAGGPVATVQRQVAGGTSLAEIQGLQMRDLLARLDTMSMDELSNEQAASGIGGPRLVLAMRAVRARRDRDLVGFLQTNQAALKSIPPDQYVAIFNFLSEPGKREQKGNNTSPDKPISQLSAGEKLSRALDFARSERDASWNEAIDGLKSPQSIFTMAFVAVAFAAAQTVPITWVADAALLAGVAVVGFFTGASAATFVIDIGKFFLAVSAQNEDDLKRAGKALADAVAIFGITAITGALTEGIGAGLKGASTPLNGPPPSGYADAFAPGSGFLRVPIEMVPTEAPTIPPNMETRGGGSRTTPKAKPPAAKAPATDPPVAGAKDPQAGTEAPPNPAGTLPEGYRPEPTLKNAGWATRPSGGELGEAYARKVTGSNESLYVNGLEKELGGTGFVELDGYRAADRMLLDAKDAGLKSIYDVSGAYKTPPDNFTVNFKVPNVLNEAIRQGHALEKSGAAGIEWHISNETVVISIRRLFAEHGIGIKVIFTPR